MDGPPGSLPPFRTGDNPRVVSPPIGRAVPIGVPTTGPSMNVGDIYYVLFRHKWKILICTLLGIGAAAAFYILMPAPYQSEAKLFIRYVTEARTAGPLDDEARTKSPDQRGETIINSEIAILTSLDLATQVATSIGADRVLTGIDGDKDITRAAAFIQHNLKVEAPLRSSIITVKFAHPEAEMVQPILRELVSLYLKRHAEIHQSAGIVGDFLGKETDNLRSRLAGTEDALRKALAKAGVISLEESKKALSDQINRLRQEILTAQAELAQRASVYNEFSQRVAPPDGETEVKPPPQSVIDEYRAVSTKLLGLQQREQELLAHFKPESTRVVDVRTQINRSQKPRRSSKQTIPTSRRSFRPRLPERNRWTW
jgi:polysaccharide biosynthesis transport protein